MKQYLSLEKVYFNYIEYINPTVEMQLIVFINLFFNKNICKYKLIFNEKQQEVIKILNHIRYYYMLI